MQDIFLIKFLTHVSEICKAVKYQYSVLPVLVFENIEEKKHLSLEKQVELQKEELKKLKEKFKELKSLVYQYKENKENEIKNLSSTQEELMSEIENYKIYYENLIDKVTLEIEDFIKKNNSNTSV